MHSTTATHIELRRNRDGQDRAHIAGTRVRVQDIYAYAEIQGLSPDEIVEQLPHLTWVRSTRRFRTISIIASRFSTNCGKMKNSCG